MPDFLIAYQTLDNELKGARRRCRHAHAAGAGEVKREREKRHDERPSA